MVVALVAGFGYFFFKQKPSSQVQESPSAMNEPLQNWDNFNTSQDATWDYIPILRNRARLSAKAEGSRKPQQASCPAESKRRDANAWLRWRREIANQWNDSKVIEREAHDEIVACRRELEALNLWNCFGNTKNFAFIATLPREGHRLGFEPTDVEYYKKILDYDPEALKLPNEIKNGVPEDISAFGLTGSAKVKSYAGLAKINSLPNWKVLKYSSRTVANPNPWGPQSYNRLLFMHTGPRYDKYVQFTLSPASVDDPFAARGAPQQLMDFISVEKIDKQGKELEKPVLRFAQFNRDQNGQNPKPRLDFRTGMGNADTCYACHPGGMRALSPLPGSVTPQQYKVLETMNERMASYKKTDWDGAINPEYYGPPRGMTIGCGDCHNNGHPGHLADLRRGPINHFTAAFHISHKLRIDYSMTQARLKGHLAVINYVKGIDRYTTSDRETNQRLDTVRNELLTEWLRNPSSLVFDVAYKGAKKIAAVAERSGTPYIPAPLQPDRRLNESMDKFLQETAEDQKLIEQSLFQQDDKRYKIETANWMEMRCPDTPVEARQ
jgi:hypothetical protein